MHLGVVPMRDGKLQGKMCLIVKNCYGYKINSRAYEKQGFELKRGERGSDRKHIETAKFKNKLWKKRLIF